MKRFLKILAWIIGSILVIAGLGISYLMMAYPKIEPPPPLSVPTDSATIERGRYIADNVATCTHCHSRLNIEYYGSYPPPGTFAGGHDHSKLLKTMGLDMPGLYVPNITPKHLGSWTDGEIYRAITSGISKDGRVLFPMMPYEKFKYMADSDVKAVIAYLRTLTPVDTDWPASSFPFPMNLILRTVPEPSKPQPMPSRDDKVAYGKYLVTIASCESCHTPPKGDSFTDPPDPEKPFAGGMWLTFTGKGTIRSANITPHETGLGSWTKEQFIAKFKSNKDKDGSIPVPIKEFNTIMPWIQYAQMTEDDLGAIYEYLRTLKPIKNEVVKFTPEGEAGA